jgi:dTMP kinase
MMALTELLLYGASRYQHVHQVLKPALSRGEILLCDRFCDATLAYQGYGRLLDLGLVDRVNGWAADGLAPDLTILLDCPVDVGLRRSWERLSTEGKRSEESRFEVEDRAFHRLVREGYLEIARCNPQRVVVLDSSGPAHEIQEEIRRRVLAYLDGL